MSVSGADRHRPKPTVSWWIRSVLAILFYYTGVVAVVRLIRKLRCNGRVIILTYHGIRTGPPFIEMFRHPLLFEAELDFLKESYTVVDLGSAIHAIRTRSRLRNDLIVLTFDDGYADNYETAWPLARVREFPITIFITVDCIEYKKPTFIAGLLHAIEKSSVRQIDLSDYDLGILSLTDREKTDSAIRAIDRLARRMTDKDRDALLRDLYRRLGVPGLKGNDGTGMLTWEHLKEMQESGVTVGAHTLSHPVLSLLGEAEMEEEIRGAKTLLESRIGRTVDHFAYPYGSPNDINDRVVAMTEKAGYRSAAVLYHDRFEHRDMFRLERMMLPADLVTYPWGGFSRAMFACEISGLFDRLLRWRKKRNDGHSAARY